MFYEEKNSTHQVSRTLNQHAASSKNKISVRKKFDEQNINSQQVPLTNQFHVEKYECKSFTKSKINMQQVSRTKISTQQVPKTKSVSYKYHEQNQFKEEKNQSTSFRKKIINMQQVSRTKKSVRNRFHEQN